MIAKNKSTKNWSHMEKKNPTTTFIKLLRTKKLKNKYSEKKHDKKNLILM